MARMIDADKCPCILCEDTRNAHCTYEHRSCKKFCNWLNKTAYDVEKVVAELEDHEQYEMEHGNYHTSFAYGRAIEIVRKGGVK